MVGTIIGSWPSGGKMRIFYSHLFSCSVMYSIQDFLKKYKWPSLSLPCRDPTICINFSGWENLYLQLDLTRSFPSRQTFPNPSPKKDHLKIPMEKESSSFPRKNHDANHELTTLTPLTNVPKPFFPWSKKPESLIGRGGNGRQLGRLAEFISPPFSFLYCFSVCVLLCFVCFW